MALNPTSAATTISSSPPTPRSHNNEPHLQSRQNSRYHCRTAERQGKRDRRSVGSEESKGNSAASLRLTFQIQQAETRQTSQGRQQIRKPSASQETGGRD